MNKQEIIDMYFNKSMSIKDIANKFCKSRTAIYKIVKKDQRYESIKKTREQQKNEIVKEKQDLVEKLFFTENKKVCEISKELQISNSLITRIIKSDSRYKAEKSKRKIESKKRNVEATKKIINKKRQSMRSSYDNSIFSGMMLLQKQNAISMSRNRKMSTTGIVAANLNHYNYDSKRQRLVFDNSCGVRPVDLPRSIKIHTCDYIPLKTYEESEV
ncbi:helix-turn-helix domain-containing protein [Clostridium felsineum]|uniref:helix-turn-helix domain-containing protein n=1 Tax=Clostridium felsineum TaxID=36839 RepID=UPI00214D8879|nr:helix-turn-helix domain-containing protein [Clostridium felsineum]MCR3759356.1 helix-turn-helix domain-containing protein [Clostridium felsineum]